MEYVFFFNANLNGKVYIMYLNTVIGNNFLLLVNQFSVGLVYFQLLMNS